MDKSVVSRRRLLRSAGAIGAIGVAASQPTGAQGRSSLDRHIVGVEPGRADVARDAAEDVYRVLDFGTIGQAVAGRFPEEALTALEQNPNVRYVEGEGEMEIIDHASGSDDPTEEQVLPWGIDRVGADIAHHEGETGGGANIAIIDTGIDPTHETLEVVDGEAIVKCAGDCAAEWDDDNGHGTHCAGTTSAIDNDVGVVGVAPEADLYAVKVLDGDGVGTFSDIAAGIEWTADRNVDVGSLSLGGERSETVEDACKYAFKEGTLLVAAAGNDGDGTSHSTVRYPAAYDEVIAVSAIDEDDDIASFSSRGEEVELAAPGVDVLSSRPGDDYGSWNGTSMACPHVSGAGAQLMEHDYTNEEARDRLRRTAEDIGLDDGEQGNGLLDVAAALDEEDGEKRLAVETLGAADVDESSAILVGELVELEGYDEVTVRFEYGESGDSLPNATDGQRLESAGEFDAEAADLESDADYEFRAVAEAGDDRVAGETLAFTTEDDEGGGETVAPGSTGSNSKTPATRGGLASESTGRSPTPTATSLPSNQC